MLLKRFEAETLPKALEHLRSECGEDALIVETRSTRHGYLVVAADPDATQNERDQAGRLSTPTPRRWTRGFEPVAQKAAEFGLSPRILAAVEKALLGTRIELGRAGDPALGSMCKRILTALLPTESRFEGRPVHDDFGAITVVGSTGVGKTTTLAKLAARAVADQQDIAIVTLDTYRVAAVEQLRAFADLLDAPMDVAFTPQDLRRCLKQHQHRDRVYIDTTGRSPLDRNSMSALGSILASRETARMLCLPAATRRHDALVAIEAYDRFGIDGVCLTKWDETTMPGEALSTIAEHGIPLSHLGTGQEVPADILVADTMDIASRAFGEQAQEACA